MKVAVYGATGYTGKLITKRLLNDGHEVCAVARDETRLQKLASDFPKITTKVAPVHNHLLLRRALEGNDTVVNAAGPYVSFGSAIVEAAIDAKINYVDICGEQDFLKSTFEQYDELAKEAGIAVVNGLAFEVAIADWGASVIMEQKTPDTELSVIYRLRGSKPTQGTLLSIMEALSRDGWIWKEGLWDPVAPGAMLRKTSQGKTAVSFPGGEVISIPRHIDLKSLQTYLWISNFSALNKGLGYVGRVLPFFAQTPAFSSARSLVFKKRRMPTEKERQQIEFSIEFEAGDDKQLIAGQDIYGTSADIVATALRLQQSTQTGVIAPSQFVDAKLALNALSLMPKPS